MASAASTPVHLLKTQTSSKGEAMHFVADLTIPVGVRFINASETISMRHSMRFPLSQNVICAYTPSSVYSTISWHLHFMVLSPLAIQ